MAATCRKFASCLYIIASNYSAVVGIYIVIKETVTLIGIFGKSHRPEADSTIYVAYNKLAH